MKSSNRYVRDLLQKRAITMPYLIIVKAVRAAQEQEQHTFEQAAVRQEGFEAWKSLLTK